MMIFSDEDQKARHCYNEIENEGIFSLCHEDKEVEYLGYQHILVRLNFPLQKGQNAILFSNDKKINFEIP